MKSSCQQIAMMLIVCTSITAVRAQDIRSEVVIFEPGASSAIVEDSIRGAEIVDYRLYARQGQYANISMATSNTANYFNLMAPGETVVAMFNGSISENQYEGILAGERRLHDSRLSHAERSTTG